MGPIDNLRISLVQTDLFWEDLAANFNALSLKLAALPATDVVVLPEMFCCGFTMHPDRLPSDVGVQAQRFLARQAKLHQACFCGSTPFVREDGSYVNRFLFVEPSGKTTHYDKRHRFAMAGEDELYQAGSETPVVVSYRGWRLLLQVCYDLRFPCFSRNRVGQEAYDVALYVANWPATRRKHWQVLAKARAIENQCYVAIVNRIGSDANGLNYVGDSALIDPMGEYLCELDAADKISTTSLSKTSLQTIRTKLPFLQDADDFKLL